MKTKSKSHPHIDAARADSLKRVVSRLNAMLEMWEAAWLYLVQKHDFDGASKIRPIKSGLQELLRDAQADND